MIREDDEQDRPNPGAADYHSDCYWWWMELITRLFSCRTFPGGHRADFLRVSGYIWFSGTILIFKEKTFKPLWKCSCWDNKIFSLCCRTCLPLLVLRGTTQTLFTCIWCISITPFLFSLSRKTVLVKMHHRGWADAAMSPQPPVTNWTWWSAALFWKGLEGDDSFFYKTVPQSTFTSVGWMWTSPRQCKRVKKKKHSVWMLESGFLQHLLVSSPRRRQPRSPWFDSRLMFGEGSERQPAAGKPSQWPLDLSSAWAGFKGNRSAPGRARLRPQLAGDVIKVAGRAVGQPLIQLSVQISKSLFSSAERHAGGAVTKCFSPWGGGLSCGKTSVTKLESVKYICKISTNICSQYIMYINAGSLKKTVIRHMAAFSEHSQTKCCF